MLALASIALLLIVPFGESARARGVQRASDSDHPAEVVADSVVEALAAASEDYRDVLQHEKFATALRHFGECQSGAAHMQEGDLTVQLEVDKFHNNLDEVLRALADVSKGTTSISVKDAAALRKRLQDIKSLANREQALQEVGLARLSADAPALDAVAYGSRVFQKIQVELYGRGLARITGEGTEKTDKELRPALLELDAAIHAMVDSYGERVLQVDEKGKALGNQCSTIEAAFKRVERDAGVLCNVHPFAKERVALVLEDLKLLRENLKRVKALSAKPKQNA